MNWISKVPPFESQYSADTHVDAEDCVEESLCHIIYMLTGIRYSPRALAWSTNVTPSGSRTSDALNTVRQVGLIPYDLWPSPQSFTWESYYEPVPDSVLTQAHHYDIDLAPADLNVSPLWTELNFGNVFHVVAQINATQYFDSELGGPIKTINKPIGWTASVKLKRKLMPQIKLVNIKGEEGILLAAANMEELKALCAVFGKDPSQVEVTV